MHSFRKLLPHLRKYRWQFTIVLCSAIGLTSLNLLHPLLIRSLIRTIQKATGQDAARQVALLGILLAATYFIRSFFRFIYMYLGHKLAYSFVGDMRVLLYEHLQKLSARFFSNRQTGELLKRVMSDTRDLEPLLAHYIPDMTVNCLVLLGVGTILFSLNPKLAALAIVPMPLLLFGNLFFGKRVRSTLKDSSSRLGRLTGVIQDNLVGIKEIQLFTQEGKEYERIHAASSDVTRIHVFGLKMQSILAPSMEFLTSLGIVFTVFFGGSAVLGRTMPVEDLVAFLLYLGIFYLPVTQMAQLNEMLQVAHAAADHVVEVLNVDPDVDDSPGAFDPGRLAGAIEFKNVSFNYNERVPTLNDISFRVDPGKVLALVGSSGAGKTTIASLVPRFYDVAAGSVTIDGIDVRRMTMKGLRSNISMVMQDVFLFNGTVGDNIRYSNIAATEDDLVEAAKAAFAHQFISDLPDGYDTRIGERGVRLSGGQKQRLAIARAVLRNAPILILDEATSAVDTETEAEIQAALNRLMRNRTTVVIAHRLSTIKNADHIVVLDKGSIVETGDHRQLLSANGAYRRLYEANDHLNYVQRTA